MVSSAGNHAKLDALQSNRFVQKQVSDRNKILLYIVTLLNCQPSRLGKSFLPYN